MSVEAAVVVWTDDQPVYEHMPPNRTAGYLPDSQKLWDVIWENRERLSGIAHSHPDGCDGPSWEDVTTFSAVERALGKRLKWWVCTRSSVTLITWLGPGLHQYQMEIVWERPPWYARLMEISR